MLFKCWEAARFCRSKQQIDQRSKSKSLYPSPKLYELQSGIFIRIYSRLSFRNVVLYVIVMAPYAGLHSLTYCLYMYNSKLSYNESPELSSSSNLSELELSTSVFPSCVASPGFSSLFSIALVCLVSFLRWFRCWNISRISRIAEITPNVIITIR